MSDNTMSTAASSPALSAQQTPAAGPQHDFASDTELVMAAIARMEAAVRGERATHERLRAELDSMAEAIAHVKTSVRNAASSGKPVNVLVLLTWLEARVHGMRGYLGQPPAQAAAPLQEAAAEPAVAEAIQPESAETPATGHEIVPTVSDVVSRLGRASEALEKDAHALEQTAAADDVPTVSMLGAMVEALTAPESVATEAKAEAEAPAHGAEPAVVEQAQAEPEAAVFVVAPEVVLAEAAAEANVVEATIPETVADDPPEVTAFAEELGATEPMAAEAEVAPANEAEIVQPEAFAAEAVIVGEPAEDAPVTERVDDTDPSAEATVLICEPAEPETTAVESALLDPEGVVQEAGDETTADIAPTITDEAETVAVAEAAHAAAAHEPSPHEFELLTRFAAMEAIPFMRDEIGTAVIFEPKAEFDPAAEQMAFETPAKPVGTAAESCVCETQPEGVVEAPQPEAAMRAAAETIESAPAEAEATPGAESPSAETHHDAAPEVQPELTVARWEPATATASSNHAVYAGISSLPVPPAMIGATAALTDAPKPETALAGTLEISPVEIIEPETEAAEIPTIEFFDIDEPKTKADAAATASIVIAESALDVIVAEPAPVEPPIVAESADTTAPETSAATIETVLTGVTETSAPAEMVQQDVTAEIAGSAQAPAEAGTVEIAETIAEPEAAPAEVEAPIAGPSEAERAALAQAIAEMAAAVVAKSAAASVAVAEAQTEPAPAVPVEAANRAATPTADTIETADDDLSDLFAPEPDAALDPNNVLLGLPSAPAYTLDPATAAVLPMHDMALPQAAQAVPPAAKPMETAKPDVAKDSAPTNPHDPLAPLKAMSDEEKIALFS